jgi:carboxylesterase
MDRTGFEDWYDATRESFLALRSEHGRVVVAGLSMGGSLSLRLAQEFQGAEGPDGIIPIAAPVRLWSLCPPRGRDWRLPLVPLLRHVRPLWPGSAASEESRAIAPWQGYEGVTPLSALTSLMHGLRRVRRELGRIHCPVLVIHCPTDRSVHVQNALEIIHRVSSAERSLRLLPLAERTTSHHLLTTHRETRRQVQDIVRDFVYSR